MRTTRLNKKEKRVSMQQERLPELGEEFAAISSGVCGISPFTAKLILYNELDDGY